ncbi:MAG: cell division protein, partial [Epsilonproteobacteria bacterium]|nr:cell division protein [Campylobacterota bacterium]
MQTDKYLFLFVVTLIGIAIIFSFSLPAFTVLRYDYNEFHYLVREFFVGILSILVMWSLSRLDPDKYLNKIG